MVKIIFQFFRILLYFLMIGLKPPRESHLWMLTFCWSKGSADSALSFTFLFFFFFQLIYFARKLKNKWKRTILRAFASLSYIKFVSRMHSQAKLKGFFIGLKVRKLFRLINLIKYRLSNHLIKNIFDADQSLEKGRSWNPHLIKKRQTSS